MVASGYPQKQAVAAALSTARRSGGKSNDRRNDNWREKRMTEPHARLK
jgi:hypothetical protein